VHVCVYGNSPSKLCSNLLNLSREPGPIAGFALQNSRAACEKTCCTAREHLCLALSNESSHCLTFSRSDSLLATYALEDGVTFGIRVREIVDEERLIKVVLPVGRGAGRHRSLLSGGTG
jgi:hypothetical protein